MKIFDNFINIVLVLVFFTISSYANESTRIVKTKEISGYGSTKSLAIQNALIEAVKQKNGAYIQSVKSVFKGYSQKSLSNGHNSISITKMQDSMRENIKEATAGFIDNYEVLDIIKHDDEYEAIISISTVEYRVPGNNPNKRRKMVIVPSYLENLVFDVLNKLKSRKDVSYNLNQELTNAITQTRKFTVLDRGNKSAYNNETTHILSPNAQKDEILKLGQVLGADYLVVTTIKEFKIIKQTKLIKSIGQKTVKLKAFATINYQILTMSTRQIKWSNTMDFEFQPKGHTNQQIYYNVMKKITRDLTNEIIENIYPIRVAKVSGNGDAILTQSATLGSIYDVFKMGEKLFDPYTKEFLGYDEVQTGKIKITRSLAKVAYGEVIEGYIQNNSICRKSKQTIKSRNNNFHRKSNYQKENPDTKKYIAIKNLTIDSYIDKYKYTYIKNANIDFQIKNIINKSKKYKVLTRDKAHAQAMMDENEFADSDLSDNMDSNDMRFSNVDYQLLPRITKFKLSTKSVKIPDIDAYENSDYILMELNIVVLDRKGEVIFESTKSEKHSRGWGSENKLKRKRPTFKAVSKLAKKLTSSVLYDLVNKKAQLMNKKFITVVEVAKKTIYLDLGENTDIEEGDEYPVYKEPKIKTIKRTGKTRLSYGDKIATVRIDGIYDDGAEAVVIKGKISKIKEGYILRVKKRRK